ncbi:MAG: preprotein translocase subunit SecE [Oscillospiraceae bacterium]|nr:preprotein translocase subunit SecE [Oscillospiraceae bacterium]
MADEKKKAVTKSTAAVKKEDKKLGFFARIGKWFRDMANELKRVEWPTPKKLMHNTLIALAVMAVSAVVLAGFDWVARLLVDTISVIAGKG